MSMQLIKRSVQALSAAAIFCSVPAFAGTITPTGGSFPNMTPSTVAASYGSFSAIHQDTVNVGFPPVPTVVTIAQLSGSYSTSSLDVSGLAWVAYDEAGSEGHFGRISGTLGFDLDTTTSLHFALSQTSGGWYNLGQNVTLTLRNSSNQIVLGCIGRDDYAVIGGGCLIGAQPLRGDPTVMPLDGDIELPAGHYRAGGPAASGGVITSISSPTDFDFSLTVNP